MLLSAKKQQHEFWILLNKRKCKASPVRLLRIMQVLGQNPNGAHDCVGDIKVFGPFNDAVDYKVKFPAENLVQGLLLARLGDGVPRQDELSVGAFKHCEDSRHTASQSQRKVTFTLCSHAHLLSIKFNNCADLSFFFFFLKAKFKLPLLKSRIIYINLGTHFRDEILKTRPSGVQLLSCEFTEQVFCCCFLDISTTSVLFHRYAEKPQIQVLMWGCYSFSFNLQGYLRIINI